MNGVGIEIEALEKSFGSLKVLKSVSCKIEPGMVTAILGPNAAGKTTILKCILGLVFPDRGTIRINGTQVRENPESRRLIGYMPQAATFPDNLTLKELLALLKRLRQQAATDLELIELLDLSPYLQKPLKTLSGGTKQKVSALLAIMFQPEILIFDEPTVGLDPVSSIRLKDRILQEKEHGSTVLLTSHVMSEVDELADAIVFLLDGKLHFVGSIEELRHRTGEDRVEHAVASLMQKESMCHD